MAIGTLHRQCHVARLASRMVETRGEAMSIGQQVERLKSQGRYYHAGTLAALTGQGAYGCHYGMRSELAYAVEQFMAGFKDASLALQGDRR